MDDTRTDADLDRIERSIEIDATAERVWSLLERPGWWINEHDVDPDPVVRREDPYDVVVHPEYGEFRLLTVARDEPRHIAYRWIDPDPAPGAGDGTLVEFWVEDRAEGGVVLRVAESGFASLGKSDEDRRRHVAENTEGWETELDAARRFVTGSRA